MVASIRIDWMYQVPYRDGQIATVYFPNHHASPVSEVREVVDGPSPWRDGVSRAFRAQGWIHKNKSLAELAFRGDITEADIDVAIFGKWSLWGQQPSNPNA